MENETFIWFLFVHNTVSLPVIWTTAESVDEIKHALCAARVLVALKLTDS